ncbi:MAG TPA: M23 family metallopeptidase [Longimicrobium sp.]|nr:M23 family metallopeptidase [Longimicrobium sp.]
MRNPSIRSRARLLLAGAALLLTGLAACGDAPTNVPATRAARDLTVPPDPRTDVVFGPRRFVRGTAKPVAESVSVGGNLSAFTGPFVLRIQNGAEGANRVSSARVWVDGTLVFGPERFSQRVDSLSIEVTLTAGSVLTVENAGAPGSFLEVRITGTATGGATQGEIGPKGGSAGLPGVANFQFPAGFFATPRTVAATQENDPAAYARFVELESLFRVATRTSQVVRLLAGTEEPADASFTATLVVPASLGIPAGHRPEMFVQVYEDLGMEVLDNFQLIPSSYDPATRTLTAELPTWVFTNTRRADGQHEAVFMIGTTPGGTLGVASSPSLGALAAGAECKAGFIGRPIADNVPVTSPYGERIHPIHKTRKMHWGTDFGAPNGTQIVSAADGRVERIRNQGNTGFGLYLIVRHTDGSATLYAHLDATTATVGSAVRRGDPIARSDNSGGSTGPHLHFEYVPNGEIVQNKNRIDPAPCIQDRTVTGSITVSDNGNLADDAFAVYLDNIHLGTTSIGASNNFAINNLIPGPHTLRITGVVVPDNVGTYEISLASGITFAGGGTTTSGVIPSGGSASFGIVVPSQTTQSLAARVMRMNAVQEVAPAAAKATPSQ